MRTEYQDDRDPVEQLAEKFLAEVRAGKSTSIEDYQQRYPKYASAIEGLFPTLMMMEDLKPEMRRLRDSADTLLDRNVKQLGDFCIIRKIGYGGMGIVYEAQQESLDRPVAIKVFAPTLLSSARQIRRFKREAKAAGTLHHSNIVPVLGVGEQWGIHYYIMQLIDGKGLDQVIDLAGKRMRSEAEYELQGDWRRIAELGRQIASALSYAHSRKILHRDIKPANLLLDRDGTAWVADFGLAKLMTEDDGASRTRQTVGTLRYMSPEQLEGKEDARTDIYSLGLTLYELLTWRRAFDETEHGSLLRQKTIEQPPAPRSVDNSIPRDLETIVLKTIAPEPSHRYQTAAELEIDLDRFLNDLPIRARRVSLIERFYRWSRRNRALAAACACVVALSASVLALSLWGSARLQRALDGETLERQRATASSTLAAGAFDTVFDRFGIEPISGIERPGEPMLSAEAAALLEDLLEYYEQLAEQSANRPDLMLKTAAAQATIGNIRARLGEHTAAVAAYRSAIAYYSQLPNPDVYQATMASIHNHIGHVLRFHGREQEGTDEHQVALDVLNELMTKIGPANSSLAEQARIEMARTHYLMGSRVRPGMGPQSMPPPFAFAGRDANDEWAIPPVDSGAVASLDRAIDILEEERNRRSLQPAELKLLARCLRERVHDNLVKRTEEETTLENESVTILRELAREHPEHLDYQFDLMESLAEFSVFGNTMDASVCDQAEQRLRQAVGIGATLVARRPDVTIYMLVSSHAHFKLATVLVCQAEGLEDDLAQAKSAEAIEHVSTAAQLISELIERFPEANGFRAWKAFFLAKKGELLKMELEPEAADVELTESVALLESIQDQGGESATRQLRNWVESIRDQTVDK